MLGPSFALIALAGLASAHIGPFGPGMFCRNGLSNEKQDNTNEVCNPLYQKNLTGFMFHGECRNFPPPQGEFLKLPAGGAVKLELAGNKGQTTLSFDGKFTSEWPDGGQHPDYENGSWDNSCITTPNLHTMNRGDAAGTVLAIAYKSDINAVGIEDLTVISVLPNSPWKREVEYEIPADLPGCDDCVCAWGWVPNNCGIPNMYMTGFKCQVTNARPDAPAIAPPQTPVWCEDDESKCVQGAKRMVIWHQDPSINNIETDGQPPQKDGQARSPGYNMKLGFRPGAQNDIFLPKSESPAPSTPAPPKPSETCKTLPRREHRRHQRRLFTLGPFHLDYDSRSE